MYVSLFVDITKATSDQYDTQNVMTYVRGWHAQEATRKRLVMKFKMEFRRFINGGHKESLLASCILWARTGREIQNIYVNSVIMELEVTNPLVMAMVTPRYQLVLAQYTRVLAIDADVYASGGSE